MIGLSLTSNQLSGSVDLTRLPVGMDYIDLSSNNFSGSVDVRRLPPSLLLLYLHTNDFEGHTDFSMLPEGMSDLDIRGTNLVGEIVVRPLMHFHFDGSNVRRVSAE